MTEEDAEQKDLPAEDSGIVDVANMTVQCHLVIKDKDTGNQLVNMRG